MQVDQKSARVLREALSKLTKMGNPFVTTVALEALRKYAALVAPHCECVDTVFLTQESKHACLDCGKRHARPDQPELFIVPPPKGDSSA